MTAIAALSAPVVATPRTSNAARTTSVSALLPEAEPLSGSTLNDAMSCLYEALSQMHQTQLKDGESQIKTDQSQRDAAVKKQMDALAKEEQDQPHGFWSGFEKIAMVVAKVAMVVASVAVSVVTLGAGAPLLVAAAIVLSVGGMVVSDTHCLGNKLSTYVGLGMEVAGAVCGGCGTSAAAGTLATVSTAGRVATVVGGAADVAAGAAHIHNGLAQAQVQQDSADAQQAKNAMQQMDTLIEWALDTVKGNDKSQRSALESVQGAMETNDETALAASSTSLKG